VLPAERIIFGRFPRPHAHVRIADRLVTKRHFEITWDAAACCHELYDYGRFSLALNGTLLAGACDRFRERGERYTGDRARLSIGDRLEIGQYTLTYIALRQ
jgi:hypothetical protein